MRRITRLLTGLLLPLMAHADNPTLYIATQNPERMGIMAAAFDTATGKLSQPRHIIETRDPAFLAVSRDGKNVYVCNTGTPGGVSAFAIGDDAALRFLNYKQSPGRGPSHISVDASDRFVLDANYGGGFVEIHARAADGSLGAQTAFVQHQGSSVHPQRQNKPYAHWIGVAPDNDFVLVADLGTDRIAVYRFDEKTGALTPNNPDALKVKGGLGPRHLAFHPNGKWLYGIQELGSEVMALSWDRKAGTLKEMQSVPMLPADFSGANTAAEIGIHANGRFLYASNRGHDSIAVYSINEKTGHLTLVERVSSQGKTPRYFVLDPTSRWLIVGNQDSANVVVFAIDQATGALEPQGEPINLAKPFGMAWR